MSLNAYGLFIISSAFFGLVALSGNAFAIQDTVKVGDFPRDIDFDPRLNNLYVPNYESGTISIIDASTMIIKDTVMINEGNSNPTRIAVDYKQHLIYVTDKISGTLSVIDGINGKVIKSIKIGESLWDIALNEDNKKLYVSDLIKNEIIILDTENFKVIKSIFINSSPWAITINQNTDKTYVASGTSEVIHIIDGNTDELINDVNPGVKPWGLSINEKSNVLYITSWDSNAITVLDLQNEQVIFEIPITSGAWQMNTNQKNGITTISNEHSNELYLLDENSKKIQTISVFDSPQSMIISPTANIIYVANPLSNSISAVSYDYDHYTLTPIIEEVISDNNSVNDELILEVIEGISNIPQREDIDTDMISGLLKNLGVTGEFDGNGIARILLDDYNKKKELQPKTAVIPTWTMDLAMMFSNDLENKPQPKEINCDEEFFFPINDIDKVNPYEIWVNILPICALS
ncbi:YncE family protein [Nitrosopumilus sp.]|uniref:YncE family protein n=1 Tax=Nitrosopumilus sp. TaxID=2024843 RepID=UPI00247C931E|nr:YncE family protein [Nitrosopumilus sp.]MCV0409519.1 YncE family protein [Nitrosopumilus sp.]